MILTIPAGESREMFGQGEYFWIAAATGALIAEVTAADGKRSTHKVASRFQLRVPSGVRSVLLSNQLATDNVVEADSGVGEYMPSNDGQRVTLIGAGGVTLEVQGKVGGVAVPVSGPLTDAELRATPVSVTYFAPASAPTDRSGTLAAAATAQQLMPAKANRRGWIVQNLSAGDLYVRDDGVAASASAGSIKVPQGGSYESPSGFVTSTSISIFGATLGQAFTAREY